MTVTEIRRDKGHLVKISLSDGDPILLDFDLCREKCIHEGDEISKEQAEKYLEESDFLRAKSRALWLLDRYTYTERRLKEKLKNSGFSYGVCERAVERLKELGVIDDNRLCLNYAEDLSRRGVSKREAYQKLLVKGFGVNTVKEALENTRFDEAEQLGSLIERKYRNKILSGDIKGVYAALVRKGFSYGSVRDALKKYSDELKITGED